MKKRIIFLSLAFLLTFASSGGCQFYRLLENIHISAIKSMHVQSETGDTFLHIVIQMINGNDKTLKISKGDFTFYIGDINGKGRPEDQAT